MANTATHSLFQSYPLDNDLQMAKLVAEGLPAATLRHLAAAFQTMPSGMASLVNITEKTILRRLSAKGRLKPDESERVARIMRVFDRAVDVLQSEDKARRWLAKPLRVLDGKSPMQLMVSEPGAREVEQVLGRLEHGVFA